MYEYLKENWKLLTDEQRQEIMKNDYMMIAAAVNIDILNYQKAEFRKKGYQTIDVPNSIANDDGNYNKYFVE